MMMKNMVVVIEVYDDLESALFRGWFRETYSLHRHTLHATT